MQHVGYHLWSRNCLPFRSTRVHPRFLVEFVLLDLWFYVWCFVLFLLAIVLSVLRFKLFLMLCAVYVFVLCLVCPLLLLSLDCPFLGFLWRLFPLRITCKCYVACIYLRILVSKMIFQYQLMFVLLRSNKACVTSGEGIICLSEAPVYTDCVSVRSVLLCLKCPVCY